MGTCVCVCGGGGILASVMRLPVIPVSNLESECLAYLYSWQQYVISA